MVEKIDFDEFQNIIKNLPTFEATDENLLSICGIDYKEKYISQILAFFFDGKREHGLGNLFVKSLLEAMGESEEFADSFEALNVELEVYTDKTRDKENGKFIDILIYGDRFNIAIEHKIYATLDNRLDLYLKHAKKVHGKREAKCVVLSLNNLSDDIKNQGYSNVASWVGYETFIQQLESNRKDYEQKAGEKYRWLFDEFVSNANKLLKGAKMDEKTIQAAKFFAENTKNLQDLDMARAEIQRRFREIIKAVSANLKAFRDNEKDEKIDAGFYQGGTYIGHQIKSDLWFYVRLDIIDDCLWYSVFAQSGKSGSVVSDENLKQIAKHLGYEVSEKKDEKKDERHEYYKKISDFEADMAGEITKKMCEIYEKFKEFSKLQS